eukprot:sb/3467369/
MPRDSNRSPIRFQRARPRGHVMIALEMWQESIHGTDVAAVPTEKFTTLTRHMRTQFSIFYSKAGTPTPTSEYFANTFSMDPAATDPLGRAAPMPGDSSSDGAFADEDLKAANRRKGGRTSPVSGGGRPGSRASAGRPGSSAGRPGSNASGRPGSRTSGVMVEGELGDLLADEEVRSITDQDERAVDNSHSTSINLNPKLDGFLQDDLRPGSRTKNRVKSPDSTRLEEQVIRDSDRVDAKGGTGPRINFTHTQGERVIVVSLATYTQWTVAGQTMNRFANIVNRVRISEKTRLVKSGIKL